MTAGRETVVVTGLGATTPLGGDVASTWSATLAGRSGVHSLTQPWAAELPVRFAALAAADPVEIVGRVQARRMDRCEQLALVAAREAWADAGAPEVDPERLGVTVTSGIGGIGSMLAAYDTLKEKGWQRISPYTVPMLMPNGSAGWISIELGARAGAHALVSACASGAEAIGYGIDMIRSGRADVVVAGGTEAAIMPLNIAAFAVMRAMSTRNDEPERASRPFDKARDGFVLGEGAGILVLETVRTRGRRRQVYADPAGAGITSDGFRIAPPRLTGPRGGPSSSPWPTRSTQAMSSTSTPTRPRPPRVTRPRPRLRHALGRATDSVAVTSTKSMTGHLLGAAGALESVVAILALREQGPADDQPRGPRRERAGGRGHRAEAAQQARLRADGGAEQRVRVRRPQRVAGIHRGLTGRARAGPLPHVRLVSRRILRSGLPVEET